MKIIFLDIDGVLNMYGASSRTFMKPYGQHIEPHLVNRLNYICENVKGLKIVISSSWRNDMQDLKKQLEEQGFKYWNKVVGKTPQAYNDGTGLRREFRGEQIKYWLLDKNLWLNAKYLVIDDEIVDIHGDYCKDIPIEKVYEIDWNEGILHKDAINIIKYFEK